jgi:hypothetical protein
LRQARLTGAARSVMAVRQGVRTDVFTSAAIAGIPIQKGADSIAPVGPLDACVLATTIDACSVLIRPWLFASRSTGAAVVFISVQVRTGSIATDGTADTPILTCPVEAQGVLVRTSLGALIETGAAVVYVIGEIRADVTASATPTEKSGVAVAAGGETLRLLGLVAAFAEGLTGIAPVGEGAPKPQWAKDRTSQGGAKQA